MMLNISKIDTENGKISLPGQKKSNVAKAIVASAAFFVTACSGGDNLWQGDDVFVEARQTTLERDVDVMSDDYQEIKNRFDALERLYVDLARNMRSQDESMRTLSAKFENVQRDPAIDSALKKLSTNVTAMQRDFKKLEGRVLSVETTEIRQPVPAQQTPAQAGQAAASESASSQPGTPATGGAQPSETSAANVAVAPEPAASAQKDFLGIHIASYRSTSQVKSGWESIRDFYSSEISGLTPLIYRQNQEGIGTFLRLIVGPFTDETEANRACGRLRQKSSDQFCTVTEYQGEAVQ